MTYLCGNCYTLIALKDIFLITPPFTQLNTPYPATAYLKGFLNTKGISSYQMDLGMEVILELFTEKSFRAMFALASRNNSVISENCERIYALREHYLRPLNEVVRFLQGKNNTLARQICTGNFLPQASRFDQMDDLEWAFGNMGMQDKAKHLATLYLEDLSDFIVECIDENFGFSRYAERLGRSANSFDQLYNHLQQEISYIDTLTLDILDRKIQQVQPTLIGISVPFPGNLYSAFRCAQFIKSQYPTLPVSMGGGFPNTELRSVSDIRVFEFFDYITLDDGELPLELLVSNLLDPSPSNPDHKLLKRTFLVENQEVIYNNNSPKTDYKLSAIGTPDYSDLFLSEYISVIEIANPMHSLWSDGRWNKLTMAHGCYWGKCTFCDISLDYIKLYHPVTAKLLVDRMEQLIAQTGENGFHFVDEAAPPALMKSLALEILRRNLTLTWWANIRFEKNFTRDLCRLLKASGCIAISGGLEVASDRLLQLIKKGVTVAQVAEVTRNLTDANIMVHSYLMYGYPTQSVQETVDSLEMVRQLFERGVLQSGFWHQFALTAHSPIGMNPSQYGITPDYKTISFANNDVEFKDSTGIDHSKFSYGLSKSLYNYMHGIGFEMPLQAWFDFKIPRTSVQPGLIQEYLNKEQSFSILPTAKVIWMGQMPKVTVQVKTKRGITRHHLLMSFHDTTTAFEIRLEKGLGEWLIEVLPELSLSRDRQVSFGALKSNFESRYEDFELFWFSKPMRVLSAHGLLVV